MEAEHHAVRRRHVLGTLAGVALAGTVGVGLLDSRLLIDGRGRQDHTAPSLATPSRRLAEAKKMTGGKWNKTHCSDYPWLNFVGDKPLYNHLANKGEKFGKGDGEGLVYETIAIGKGWGDEMGKKVLLVLNGTNPDYHPFSPHLNGRQGFYGSVNLQSGSHLDIKVTFIDQLTMKPLKLE